MLEVLWVGSDADRSVGSGLGGGKVTGKVVVLGEKSVAAVLVSVEA